MSKIFYTNIDLKKNQLENARIHNVTEFPSSPVIGQIVYLTAAVSGYTANNLYMYTDAGWVCCVKKGNITGGNEILIGSAADTATGSGITIANSTTGLAPSSDTTVPTSKAVADYVGSLAGGITYKGTIGASPATVQTLPTTGVHVGDAYAVATAGTYSPLTTPSAVGDLIICNGVNGSTVSWTNVPVDFIVDNKAATIALGDSNFTTIATIDGKDVTLKVEGIEAAEAQSGSDGNVITGITATGNDITYTKGLTAVTTITGTANSGVVTNISQSGDTVTVTSADLTTAAPTGTNYITSVSQAANGKITVNGGTFDTAIPSSNPSTSNAPTTSAVKTYVDDSIAALDATADADTASGTGYATITTTTPSADFKVLNSITETDGKLVSGDAYQLKKLAATGAAEDASTAAITDGATTDPRTLYPAGTVQGTLEAIARDLASATSGAVNDVTMDGTSVVSSHTAALVSDANSPYASGNELATVGTVTNAINALDVSTDKGAASISGSTITINAVQQENGLIKDGGTTTINLEGTYDASTNKIATQSTVTNAIDALGGSHDVVTIGSYTPQTGENATQKIEFFDATQTNGAISTNQNASDTLYLSQAVTAANPIITKDDLSGIVGAMVYKGAVNSNSDLPSSGVQAGWTYVVATAGTYAGQDCEVGDMIIAKDSTPTWNVINGENQVTNNNPTIVAGASTSSTIATVDGTAITASVSVTAGSATVATISDGVVTITPTVAQEANTGTIQAASGTSIVLDKVATTGLAGDVDFTVTGTAITPTEQGGTTATVQEAITQLDSRITNANITIDGHKGAITTGAGLTDVAADGGSFGINIDSTNDNGLYIDANNNTLAMHIATGSQFGTVKVTAGNGLTLTDGVVAYAHNTTPITIASLGTGNDADIVTITSTLTPDASDAMAYGQQSIVLAKVAKTGAAADVSIADSGSVITATNVEDALQELATRTTASANVFSGSKAVAVGGTMTITLTPVTGGSVTARTDATVSVRDSAGNEVECDKAYGSSGAIITLTFYNNTSETFDAVVTTKNNVASITVS